MDNTKQAFSTTDGLTKREYFAAQALAGMGSLLRSDNYQIPYQTLVKDIIEVVDHLIKELEK